MKYINGSSSESVKCAFCGKNTSSYFGSIENGVEINIWSHIDCQKPLEEIFSLATKLIKKGIKDV